MRSWKSRYVIFLIWIQNVRSLWDICTYLGLTLFRWFARIYDLYLQMKVNLIIVSMY